MHEVLRTLSEIGIVPVVALKDAADAVPLARALCAGGIPTAEVTFRTDAAAASIAAMRQEVPEMLVGAGTVLTVENAEAAVAAGAAYIVTPGISEPVVRWCIGHGVPVLPGVKPERFFAPAQRHCLRRHLDAARRRHSGKELCRRHRPVRRGCARDARLYPAARGHEYLRPTGGPAALGPR